MALAPDPKEEPGCIGMIVMLCIFPAALWLIAAMGYA